MDFSILLSMSMSRQKRKYMFFPLFRTFNLERRRSLFNNLLFFFNFIDTSAHHFQSFWTHDNHYDKLQGLQHRITTNYFHRKVAKLGICGILRNWRTVFLYPNCKLANRCIALFIEKDYRRHHERVLFVA